jgi:small subunit ribosomal protein S20
MPHIPVHPSAEKRHRQSVKRFARNHAIKAQAHTAQKRALEAIGGTDKAVAEAEVRRATKVLCKAGSKGTLHRNTVARRVSRLSKRLHKAHGTAATS